MAQVSLAAINRRKALAAAKYRGLARWKVHLAVAVREDGNPVECPISGKKLHMLLKPNPMMQAPTDQHYHDLRRSIDAFNEQPNSRFDSFFEALEPFLHGFRGGNLSHMAMKRSIMQVVRTHLIEELLGLGDTDLTFEAQEGPYMHFTHNNQPCNMAVDNLKLGVSSFGNCKSTNHMCKNMPGPAWCIGFVLC